MTANPDTSYHVFGTQRDDHPQYARTDGTRTFTGTVTVPALTVAGSPIYSTPANARAPINSQSVIAGQTAMVFGTPTFDTASGFSSSVYTCKVAGTYQVNVAIACASIAGAQQWVFELLKNGVLFSGSLSDEASTSISGMATWSDLVPLVVNDTIGLSVGSGTSGTAGGTVSGVGSFLSLVRVSA